MKQTAVEYLEEFLKQYDCAYSSLDYCELKIPMHIFDKKIGQAKEMEKMYYTEFEVFQLLLKLQQTESYDNLYAWFQENKKTNF
jgi:hypothetical protein